MSAATKKDELAEAIRECLGNSTYTDGSENLTTAIDLLARSVPCDSTLNQIGFDIQTGLREIASAINNLAEAIRETRSK